MRTSSHGRKSSIEKSADSFLTAREVADQLQVPKHRIHFWERKFRQVRPMKLGGNRRYYRPRDVAVLRAIHYLLYEDFYTIKGVQRILRESRIDQLATRIGSSPDGKPAA